MSCTTCTKLKPITESTASGCSRKTKRKLTKFRLGCCDELVESIAPSNGGLDPSCAVGYIDDLTPVVPLATPLKYIDVINTDDVDENDEFSFDRTEGTGEQSYNVPIKYRYYNPEQQCTHNSLKGRDVCLFYQIEGQDGVYVWRRMKGTVLTVSGGLIAGFVITIDILNPAEQDAPLFVNLGTAALTTAAIDALTEF
jgi:hypothetical protein